jgi:hypothetical protein
VKFHILETPQKKATATHTKDVFGGKRKNGPKLPDLEELVLEIVHILDNRFQHVAKISRDS